MELSNRLDSQKQEKFNWKYHEVGKFCVKDLNMNLKVQYEVGKMFLLKFSNFNEIYPT